MKKSLSLILCLLVFSLALCGCGQDSNAGSSSADQSESSAETTAPSKVSISAEEAVQIYINNKDIWQADAQYADWYGYLFLDLNFDGISELISCTTSGSGNFSENSFYTLDTENNTVVKLSLEEGQAFEWDFSSTDYPKLYKNNESGQMKYMVYDNCRAGAGAYSVLIGELSLSEATVNSNNLWFFEFSAANATAEKPEERFFKVFDENGTATETDEATYNDTLAQYDADNTLVPFTFSVVEGTATDYDFSELTQEEQYDKLLASYKAFAY